MPGPSPVLPETPNPSATTKLGRVVAFSLHCLGLYQDSAGPAALCRSWQEPGLRREESTGFVQHWWWRWVWLGFQWHWAGDGCAVWHGPGAAGGSSVGILPLPACSGCLCGGTGCGATVAATPWGPGPGGLEAAHARAPRQSRPALSLSHGA